MATVRISTLQMVFVHTVYIFSTRSIWHCFTLPILYQWICKRISLEVLVQEVKGSTIYISVIPLFSKLAEFTAHCQLENDWTCFVEHNFQHPPLSQDSLMLWIAPRCVNIMYF